MTTSFTRADLEQSFPNLTPKVRAALEEIPKRLSDAIAQGDSAVAATTGISNATVLTLSANDAFGNERILAHGDGVVFQDNGPGNTFVIALANNFHINGGFRVTLNAFSDTDLDLPSTGRLLTNEDFSGGPYADDAAAAAAGVQIGAIYRKSGGAVVWRQA